MRRSERTRGSTCAEFGGRFAGLLVTFGARVGCTEVERRSAVMARARTRFGGGTIADASHQRSPELVALMFRRDADRVRNGRRAAVRTLAKRPARRAGCLVRDCCSSHPGLQFGGWSSTEEPRHEFALIGTSRQSGEQPRKCFVHQAVSPVRGPNREPEVDEVHFDSHHRMNGSSATGCSSPATVRTGRAHTSSGSD